MNGSAVLLATSLILTTSCVDVDTRCAGMLRLWEEQRALTDNKISTHFQDDEEITVIEVTSQFGYENFAISNSQDNNYLAYSSVGGFSNGLLISSNGQNLKRDFYRFLERMQDRNSTTTDDACVWVKVRQSRANKSEPFRVPNHADEMYEIRKLHR